MTRSSGVTWLAVGLGLGFFAAACGAENKEAPRATPSTGGPQQCRGFAQLMPNFEKAISTGQTDHLRTVIEKHLLVPLRAGDAPPVNDVLRSIFTTLTRFATKPPEPGAVGGQLCAGSASAPPLNQANELCEMRRALDMLVHQGKGLAAIKVLEPVLLGVFRYIVGTGSDGVSHYEVAGAFSGMCAQDANCQLSNGLDLIIALSAYMGTTDGKKLGDDLSALTAKPSIQAFLDPASVNENDFVAIAKALAPVVQDPNTDATALGKAFDNLPLPAPMQADLQPVVADLKALLGRPELMGPTRKALTCFTTKDKNWDAVRMLYRLAIRDKKPEFGVTRLTQVLEDLQAVDQRGALVFLAGTLAKAVRTDDQAIDSAANVCRTLLSTTHDASQPQSNAELALPELTSLVEHGIIEEAICAIDTLFFGCAGGAQPACPR